MTNQEEGTPIIPAMRNVMLAEIDMILRGMFNEHTRHELEKEFEAELEKRLAHVWTTAGRQDEAPTPDVVRGIIKRYVDQTPHLVNEQKLLAHLHATFNSLHPWFFETHDKMWSELRKTTVELGCPPFGQPHFWTDDPMKEMLAKQRRVV